MFVLEDYQTVHARAVALGPPRFAAVVGKWHLGRVQRASSRALPFETKGQTAAGARQKVKNSRYTQLEGREELFEYT
jgi:hypothetical protein